MQLLQRRTMEDGTESLGLTSATKLCELVIILRIFHPFVEKPPHGRICMKFYTGGHLADVINRAEFCLNQIRGFDSVGGRIFCFPIGTRCRR